MTAQREFERLSGKVFIDGAFQASAATDALEVVDPATEEVVGRIPDTPAAEIDEAIAIANRAQRGWARCNALTRAVLMHEVATNMRRARGLIGEMLTREMGKPYKETTDEVDWSSTAIDYYAEVARHEDGRVIGPAVDGQFHYTRKEPLGVVVIILPFNYPLCLLCWEAAAALASGNAVIVKPSEQASLSTLAFMETFAPLSAGLIQCVTGAGEVGRRLVESADTHMVAFTGSVPTGQIVARACAETFKRCLIEASGNDPFLVMPSAPLDMTARGAAFAAYLNCGQVCTSAERFFVHADIHDAFVERMVANARALRIGNGLERVDMGPMVTRRERDRYEAVVPSATRYGIDSISSSKPQFGNRGWIICVFLQYVSIIGWNSLLLIFFAKSVAQLFSATGITGADSGVWIVPVATAIACLGVYLVLLKGASGIERVTKILFLFIVGVGLWMIYMLLNNESVAIAAAKPAYASGSRLWDYTTGLEIGIVSLLSWWPYIGAMVRESPNAHTATLPSMLGMGLPVPILSIIGLAAILALETSDPSAWLIQLGGTVYGSIALL